MLLHTEVAWLETGALRALVWARSGTGLTAATPRAELERRWGVLVAASPPEGDQPVGLRAFLNADHYLTTDTIAQYDRYLRDLQVLGNVALCRRRLARRLRRLGDAYAAGAGGATRAHTVLRQRRDCGLSRPSLVRRLGRLHAGQHRQSAEPHRPGCGAHRAARSGGRQPPLAPHPAQALARVAAEAQPVG